MCQWFMGVVCGYCQAEICCLCGLCVCVCACICICTWMCLGVFLKFGYMDISSNCID